MITRHACSPLLFLVLAPGCDRITGLFDKGEDAKTEAAKTEAAKTDAKNETPPAKAEVAKTETKTAAAAAAPAATGTATTTAAAAAATPLAAPAPVAGAAPTPVAEGAPPCIVGRWKAIEYLAEVRRAIAKDPTFSKMKRTSSGGLLGYELSAIVDGKGTAKAKAESLRYVFSGKIEGFTVTVTFTLDGEVEAEYTLEGDNTIIVKKPTKNTLVARATGKVAGMGNVSKSPKVNHEFDGTFIYECTDKTLKVWRTKKDGEALDFEREAP